MKLFPRESEALEFIKGYVQLYDHAPTVTEIARSLGYSGKGPTLQLLRGLVAKGYLVPDGSGLEIK